MDHTQTTSFDAEPGGIADLPVLLIPAECCAQPACGTCGGCIPLTGRRRRCAQQCTCS
jgi:hypothetical protein